MSFKFEIEDVFSITGRGTVVTGYVAHGSARVGDNVLIKYITGDTIPTKIVGIEQFRKQCDIANEGENCGILLHGVSKNDVLRGSSLISSDWSEPVEIPEQNDFMSGYRKVDVSSLNQHDYSSVLNGGEGDKKKWWQKLF